MSHFKNYIGEKVSKDHRNFSQKKQLTISNSSQENTKLILRTAGQTDIWNCKEDSLLIIQG